MDNCIRISKNLKAIYLCKIDNEAVVVNSESIEVLYMMWGIDIVQETDTHYLVQLPEGWSYIEFWMIKEEFVFVVQKLVRIFFTDIIIVCYQCMPVNTLILET